METIFRSLLVGLLSVAITQATIINVPADYPTIQEGIDVANTGDTVLVQPATYVENINFYGKNIVVGSLFLMTGDTSYISQTVINGNRNGSVVSFWNEVDSTALLAGFTITNGSNYAGGGIFCKDSSPTLEYLTITGNTATQVGGGIRCDYSNPNFSNVTIMGNTAANHGGGISCADSNPSFSNVTITGNTATNYNGGGISLYKSSPSFSNATIKGNTAINGGGIHFNYGSSASLLDVRITGNTASSSGGGILCERSSPSLYNVTIIGNTASSGGGIYSDDSRPSMSNVTITGNTASNNGGGIHFRNNFYPPSLINCILWNDSPEEVYLSNSSINIFYSDIEGGWEGEGNISADPLFIDPDQGDFNLQEGSPCIDAGTAFFEWESNALVNLSPDEYVGSAPDMGAFEFLGAVSIFENKIPMPIQFALFNNYPNPFNPSTTISYQLPDLSFVNLSIYDVRGQLIETLVNEEIRQGNHKIFWDASNFGSGIYFYRIRSGRYSATGKCLLLK